MTVASSAAFGLVGFLMVWYATSLYGPGVTSDSVRYLSAAQSVLESRGYVLYDHSPLIYAPPLYPTLLAALGFLGLSLTAAARLLNACLFGLIIIGVDIWLAGRFKWRPAAELCILAVVLSLSLIQVSAHVWTEPLFALLVLVFLILLERAGSSQTWRQTIVLGIVAALACLTRYFGVILIPWYLFWLAVSSGPRRPKVRNALIFAAISTVPLMIWLLRNYALSGTLTGDRPSTSYAVTDVLGQTASTLAEWFYKFGEVNFWIVVGTVLVIVAAITVFFKTELKHGEKRELLCRRLAGPGFALYYILCLVALACTIHFDRVDNRLLSPIFVPLLVLVFTALDNLARGKRSGLDWRKTLVIVIGTIWLGSVMVDTLRGVAYAAERGAGGYTTTAWQESELMSLLKDASPPGTLYTNGPDVVYLMTGRLAQLSPERGGPESSDGRRGLDEFKTMLEQEGAVYLAWFADIGRPYVYSPSELSRELVLQPIRRVNDGTLYRALPPASE